MTPATKLRAISIQRCVSRTKIGSQPPASEASRIRLQYRTNSVPTGIKALLPPESTRPQIEPASMAAGLCGQQGPAKLQVAGGASQPAVGTSGWTIAGRQARVNASERATFPEIHLMRACIQRVSQAPVRSRASLRTNRPGLVVLLGVGTIPRPTPATGGQGRGVAGLRGRPGQDEPGVGDYGGPVLVVSQFTLRAIAAKDGLPIRRRARPELAESALRAVVTVGGLGGLRRDGRFRQHMQSHWSTTARSRSGSTRPTGG